MANIIIVTQQCYLLCESINYISVHEVDEEDKADNLFYSPPVKKKKRRKKPTAKQQLIEKLKRAAQLYQIDINFIPTVNGSGHSRGSDTSTVTITVRGYDRCVALFRDMIGQIREQQPDKLFLDKMVEKFFADNPIEKESL